MLAPTDDGYVEVLDDAPFDGVRSTLLDALLIIRVGTRTKAGAIGIARRASEQRERDIDKGDRCGHQGRGQPCAGACDSQGFQRGTCFRSEKGGYAVTGQRKAADYFDFQCGNGGNSGLERNLVIRNEAPRG